jgi:hypothetical protein
MCRGWILSFASVKWESISADVFLQWASHRSDLNTSRNRSNRTVSRITTPVTSGVHHTADKCRFRNDDVPSRGFSSPGSLLRFVTSRVTEPLCLWSPLAAILVPLYWGLPPKISLFTLPPLWGKRYALRGWLRHYATGRKITDSIPDVMYFSTVLAPTKPLTEMSTRNLPGGKRRPTFKADLNTISELTV